MAFPPVPLVPEAAPRQRGGHTSRLPQYNNEPHDDRTLTSARMLDRGHRLVIHPLHHHAHGARESEEVVRWMAPIPRWTVVRARNVPRSEISRPDEDDVGST